MKRPEVALGGGDAWRWSVCLAVPGRIKEIFVRDGLTMGRLDFGGVERDACLTYVPEARVGDYAIVHVGFALNLLSESEAQATLETLRQIAELDGTQTGTAGAE